MGRSKNKSTSKKGAKKTHLSSAMEVKAEFPPERIPSNSFVIWFDTSINRNDPNFQVNIKQLQEVTKYVNDFDDVQNCLTFLQRFDIEVLAIIGGQVDEESIDQIHQSKRVNRIYIWHGNPQRYSFWEQKWSKLKGNYTRIEVICENFRHAMKEVHQNQTPISFTALESQQNVDQYDPSFMYTKLFKNVLLSIDYNEDSMRDFLDYSRNLCKDTCYVSNVFEEFHRDYHPDKAIWWYTRETFLYQTLNRSLRQLEADTIVMMGFFIRDLHHQIKNLHREQYQIHGEKPFTVYRGQALSNSDFHKLQKSQGKTLSFNSFLSTSKDRETSLLFSTSASRRDDTVGILFVLTINPKHCSIPFADITRVSYYRESEILFSMHTIFDVKEIQLLPGYQRLYEVQLEMAKDHDQQSSELIEQIDKELGTGNEWERLGHLLLKIGEFGKAEELYQVLLKRATNERDRALYYHHLGIIKDQQGFSEEAIQYHLKGLDIEKDLLDDDDLDLANSYNNIGSTYDHMRKSDEALYHFKKALDIREKKLPSSHPDLAQSYNNIGTIYYRKREYGEALAFYQKALGIKLRTLPINHPSLATSYNNLASIFFDQGDYSQALGHYSKALDIREKALPSTHPDLAQVYSNLATVYSKMKEFSKALALYRKALQIQEKVFVAHHPLIAIGYRNIGSMLFHLSDFELALINFEKALTISQRSLPSSHPEIKTLSEWIEKSRDKLQRNASIMIHPRVSHPV